MVARIIQPPHVFDTLASVETVAQTVLCITKLGIVIKEKETTKALEEALKKEEMEEELKKLPKEYIISKSKKIIQLYQ